MMTDHQKLCANVVTKTYTLGSSRVEVLRGVELTVESGEFLAVMGASGSGKSTLLHILGGLDRPDSGAVTFAGVVIGSVLFVS